MASSPDVAEIRFTVVRGATPGHVFSFAPDVGSLQIGRSVDNDIVVNDPTVSRAHARIDVRADGCFLTDLGSTAGIEKMGFRMSSSPEALRSGDEFKLGDTILRFETVAARPKAGGRDGAAAAPSPRLEGMRLALEKIGLRSRRSQVVAATCVAAIVVLGLWPGPPELPRQSTKPLSLRYDRAVGFTRGDLRHLDGAIFRIPGQGEGMAVYFSSYARSGLELRAAGKVGARVEPSGDWDDYLLLVFPRAIAPDGGEAEVVFDNLAYAKGDVVSALGPELTWATRRMWAMPIDRSPRTPAAIAKDLEPLLDVAGRLDDDPAHRWKLATGLHPLVLGSMKFTGRSLFLVPVPEHDEPAERPLVELLEEAQTAFAAGDARGGADLLAAALAETEREIRTELRRLRNAAKVAKTQGSTKGQRRAYEGVVATLPDATDPRNRDARLELRRLGGGGLG